MAAAQLATWMLEREARAMLARLDRVKPFVVQETMLPAAALSPAAQAGIEQYLISGRRRLRRQIRRYIGWLHGAGLGAAPAEQQRRFTFLRLRFNLVLSQLDLFSDAITQRSENETGLWLSGLDVAAQDALELPGGYFRAPPVVCYLHRGLGGAIRRARTRLPGGGENPVSIIRIPRERMIGYGIASSLMHETGHQAAALLGLVESLRPEIQRAGRGAAGPERAAWLFFERWISEIVADLYSIARVGVSSTMGLIGLVSLPRAFVFRMTPDDPHPFPWIRVQLSCAFGEALYPDPQWRQLAGVWASFYPADRLRRPGAGDPGTADRDACVCPPGAGPPAPGAAWAGGRRCLPGRRPLAGPACPPLCGLDRGPVHDSQDAPGTGVRRGRPGKSQGTAHTRERGPAARLADLVLGAAQHPAGECTAGCVSRPAVPAGNRTGIPARSRAGCQPAAAGSPAKARWTDSAIPTVR